MYHPKLTLAATGQSIWEISKSASKVTKSIGKYLGHYQNFIYFSHWVQQYIYLCCNLAKSLLFPLNFWLFGSLNNDIFSKFRHLHHKSSVDHSSYKYCVVCMVKHIISNNFGSLAVQAVAFVEISSFAYFVLCLMYSHIQIFHYLPI